jgi:hypothetical protein
MMRILFRLVVEGFLAVGIVLFAVALHFALLRIARSQAGQLSTGKL